METYLSKPLGVEVFPLGASTDVILRKNIEEITTEDGTVWKCEEVQRRVPGAMTLEQAREQFDALWDSAEEGEQSDSVETRVADLEAAIDLLLSGAVV